jgi:enediyne biosynthesis protein E4
VHFGLGSAAKIEWMEIRWPSGLVERFTNPVVDAVQTIKEGTGMELPQNEKKR